MRYKLKSQRLTLVVDLDGTFLASHPSPKDPLYQMIQENRERIHLVFCSGRGLESIIPLLYQSDIPRPDDIIGDVGASATEVQDLKPISDIQNWIDKNWAGEDLAKMILADYPQLIRQNVPQDRRCSYFIRDPSMNLSSLRQALEQKGYDLLLSDNKYLDVLPKGVNKGSTIQKLLEYRKIATDSVLVAGDTLNDLSMLTSGLKAVAVGGSEPALLQQTQKMTSVFQAKKKGTLGILEALAHYGFVEHEEDSSQSHQITYGKSKLVMVYHRQPFDEIRKGKEVIRRTPQSPNGIIPTLMGFFDKETPASWIAWSLHHDSKEKFDTHVPVNEELYPQLTVARIPLTSEDVDLFYKKFSKEAFWPVIFSFPGKVQINHAHWQHFKTINQRFAQMTAQEAAKGALVWIHDYNLWLVPGFLRQMRPDLKIAFFHHTSFPSPDIFNILPWKKEIVGSLIQCDHVGFHIPSYAENFSQVVRSNFRAKVLESTSAAPRFMTYGGALGVESYGSRLYVEGRELTLSAHPVGTDVQRIRQTCKQEPIQNQWQQLKEEFAGRQVILSVERLDYVKGPIQKVEAFEKLLETHPELHEKIVFINIVTPPAPGMEVYKQTRDKLDQVIGRVNGRFTKVSWTPIRYFYKAFPFEELLAFYALADIAWITPLRDGLNLVCKEYIAVKDAVQQSGTLVLSEFAGASVELHGSILTNPFDKNEMVESLLRAIQLDPQEKKLRQRQLASIVNQYDVVKWGESFLESVRQLTSTK
ncbi:glucosylglycerol-phosphate synthase [Pseudobdellovibrio exovorus]|uniref:Sucrose phosphatase-like domain-containing protein n=1 Tax=Pseudobdellovibrio exovorus JSS TaxID=1184267 RepID=M4VBZ9_9BACT|nr:glucosylglycerol-phosphate synthase [Pseudobdellovibrio exovorus]AGH95990.1 hypothetical protein A11Q_1774 [Pseudobdellovibrio exovorus JSS]